MSKVAGKQKNGKPQGTTKGTHASGAKKSRDGKDEETLTAVSNGNLASRTLSRQLTKSKPSNEKQTQMSKVNTVLSFMLYTIFTEALITFCFPLFLLLSSLFLVYCKQYLH